MHFILYEKKTNIFMVFICINRLWWLFLIRKINHMAINVSLNSLGPHSALEEWKAAEFVLKNPDRHSI